MSRKNIEREYASRHGLMFFLDKKECIRGHVVKKYVSNGACFLCAAMRAKRWKKNNPERVRQNKDIWNKKNPEKYRSSIKKWEIANHDKVLAAKRRWQKAHPENGCLANRHWRKQHPEEARAACRNWRNKNPERQLSHVHARRARKANAGSQRWTKNDIRDLLRSQHSLCVGCGANIAKNYSADHKIPLVRGGSNSVRNLQLLCKPCNSSKGTKTNSEWRAYLEKIAKTSLKMKG